MNRVMLYGKLGTEIKTTATLKRVNYVLLEVADSLSTKPKQIPVLLTGQLKANLGKYIVIYNGTIIPMVAEDGLSTGFIRTGKEIEIHSEPINIETGNKAVMELLENNMTFLTGEVVSFEGVDLYGKNGEKLYYGFVIIKIPTQDRKDPNNFENIVGVFSTVFVKDIKPGDNLFLVASLYPSQLDKDKFQKFNVSMEIVDYVPALSKPNISGYAKRFIGNLNNELKENQKIGV